MGGRSAWNTRSGNERDKLLPVTLTSVITSIRIYEGVHSLQTHLSKMLKHASCKQCSRHTSEDNLYTCSMSFQIYILDVDVSLPFCTREACVTRCTCSNLYSDSTTRSHTQTIRHKHTLQASGTAIKIKPPNLDWHQHTEP